MADTNDTADDTRDTHDATRGGNTPDDKQAVVFKREISLGNIILILSVLASVGAGLFEGGMIRASLEGGIERERLLREVEITNIHRDLAALTGDVKEIRVLILAARDGGRQRP